MMTWLKLMNQMLSLMLSKIHNKHKKIMTMDSIFGTNTKMKTGTRTKVRKDQDKDQDPN